VSVFPETPVTLLARLAATCTGESAAGWERFFAQYQPVIQKFAAFGVPNNTVSQTKTRVERMIAELKALLGE